MSGVRTSHRPVDVLGSVTVETPAGRLEVTGRGRTILVSAGRSQTFRRWIPVLLRMRRAGRRGLATRLGRVMDATDLRLSFRIDGREIALFDGRSGSTVGARLLAMPGLRLRVGRLAAALAFGR